MARLSRTEVTESTACGDRYPQMQVVSSVANVLVDVVHARGLKPYAAAVTWKVYGMHSMHS